MNERKIKQLNILVLIAVFAGIISALIFVFGFSPENQNRIDSNHLNDFNEGWVLKQFQGGTDKILTLPEDIDATKDDVVVIMNVVPEDVSQDSVIAFETEFQNVVVMINDEIVYSNGVLNNQKMMKNVVPCINVAEIGSAQPGDIIAIYYASAYDKYSGKISNIYFGSKGDVVADIFKENSIAFLVSVTILIITIILTFSLVFMKNVNVDKRKSAYAFGFIFTVALWSLTSSPIMQLFINNTFGTYMTNMILLLIMPVLYIMYQRCFAVKRRFAKIFEMGIYIFSINFLTGVVFQFLSVVDFATYMIFTKALITVALVLLSGIMYLAADTYSDKTIYSNFWANTVLTVSCIVEAILSIFDFYKAYDGVVLQIGVLIFMILLVVAVEKNIIKEMNQEKDNALSNIETEKTNAVKKINTKLIYTSLNNVVNELKVKDKENSRVIYDASMYMRYNIQAITNKNFVHFSEELEYIKAYLGMQRKNYPQVDISIEDKVVEFKVPFNTIEPLVENAFNRIVAKDSGEGRIVVRSYERLDCFAIQIVDNGKGPGPDKKFDKRYSFKDIKKRLKTMCNAVIEINNKPEKGTIVTVKVPKEGFIIKE
ncbi:MAG: hypothetical protein E7259_00370 [Lachnospiraceae bacterium]|nr:hypothetical protein [Lachnospiraceae bacterium]